MEEEKNNYDEAQSKLVINKKNFIKKMKGDITAFYDVIKKIGEGSYGKTYKVRNKQSGDLRAMKQLVKEEIKDMNNFKNKINILSILDHPNIVRLFEVFEDEKYYYLLFELCEGGSLFEKIRQKRKLSETESAKIFKQLISAVTYCHEIGICHRDLKPENILFSSSEKNSTLKVIDFGLSIRFSNCNKKLTSKVGTLCYISPEIVKGNYNEKCDIWACGVILYLLLSGKNPFRGKTDQETYEKISSLKYDFPVKEWRFISKEAKKLISNMLCIQEKRYSARKVLNSKWLKLKEKNNYNLADFDGINIISYKFYNKLKKAVLIFIASRLASNESKKIKELFTAMDIDKSGKITMEEFTKCLLSNEQTSDISIEEIQEIFNSIDIDNSGIIDYTEFLAANLDREIYLKSEKLKDAFNAFDLNGKNIVSKSDIIRFLGIEDNKQNEELVKELVAQNGLSEDGYMSYNDFVKMMEKQIDFDEEENGEYKNE